MLGQFATAATDNALPLNDFDFIHAQRIETPFAYREPAASLPVIDVSPLLGTNERRKRDVAEEIGAAARDIGFFCIRNHGIERELIERAYQHAAYFFELPESQKLAYYIGHSSNHRGYVPFTEKGDYADEGTRRRYEAFDLALDLANSDPACHAGNPLLGPNVWPHIIGFREAIQTYYNSVRALGETMCRAFELHLGLPQSYFQQFMRKPTSQLRLLHYIENQDAANEADMNMGAHTDYECFTILHQSQPGLQVMDSNNEWIDCVPPEDAFTINIGDMMEVWTNGVFKSTVHRVVNSSKERYSMPFFVAADFDAPITPVAPAVHMSGRPPCASFIAGHHLLRQLIRDFPYLSERHRSGDLTLPFQPPQDNPFETRIANSQVLN
ncbi:MAG: isopenicillin N synthase family dioxygenase [Gammaproteobacteria bacterium]